jgi:hypothetical protein
MGSLGNTEIDMRLAALVGSLLMVAAATAQAQTERRELGPHVHGAGTLNIAIEGKKISIDFSAPANDILGFEHQPSTAEQKQVLDKASAMLNKPFELFAFPAAAGCTAESAKVVFNAGEPKDAKADAKPAAEEHEHADFDIEYVLTCQSPEKIDGLAFPYFKQFAGAQKLTVTVVSDKGQNQFDVTRDASNLSLK